MQLWDVFAMVLVVAAGAAFLLGESALSHTQDVRAFYWLTVGIASLHAAVQFGKPGTKT